MAAITGYSIGLFLHILAAVLAFGPTFAYGIFFAVASREPRSVPVVLSGIQLVDRYLVTPGAIILFAAGIYLLVDGPWAASELFISFGFIAIIALLGLQGAFFTPKTREAIALAERDLERGEELSEEFTQLSQRIAQMGMLAGLIVVATIFVMTVKP